MLSKHFTLLLFFLNFSFFVSAQSTLWQDVEVSTQTRNFRDSGPVDIPKNARAVSLNTQAMQDVLWQAPTLNNRNDRGIIVEIPKQEGGFETYEVFQKSNIFAENIRALYEQDIRAFVGYKVGNEQDQIHLSLGYGMFNAVIYRSNNQIDYVEYATDIKNNTFFVYRRGDDIPEKIACNYKHTEATVAEDSSAPRSGPTAQRTFRLCMTTSGSFSVEFGDSDPSVAELQAIITGQINNVLNPIFNRDFGVIFLNATINEAIFTTDDLLNSSTPSPFSDEGDAQIIADENNVFLNDGQSSSFTNANPADYDIGHAQVYNSSGGIAIAGLCDNTEEAAVKGSVVGQQGIYKAYGMSGVTGYNLNDFTIDYVAHEIGHQLGCNHTYSTLTLSNGGCNTAEENSRYETGSGTTIMSYIGVCASSNVYPDGKNRADDFFHARSIDEAMNYLAGVSCEGSTSASNPADPTVISSCPTLTIPKGTPFALVGTVTDDGSSTIAAWNQFDLAAVNYDGGTFSDDTDTTPHVPTTDGPPMSTNTSGALMRFVEPVSPLAGNTVTRVMPDNAEAGLTETWEVLPTVARSMTFRLLARDNQAFGRTASVTTNVTVTNDGPMLVSEPMSNQDAAQNTDVDVVFSGLPSSICGTVDIFLSTDDGDNYTALATDVANTGSHTVTIPGGAAVSTEAYILVQCHTTSGTLFGSCTAFQVSPMFNITAALPVELSDIKAEKSGRVNKVLWSTTREENNVGFELERSEDGRTWEKMAFIAGVGNSESLLNYEWTDENPLSPLSYYRLRQIDSDGQFSYSKLVKVVRENHVNAVSVFPNPNTGVFNVVWSENINTEVQMELFDLTGRVLHRQVFSETANTVNLESLPTGTYFMILQNEAERLFKKIVKE